MTHHMDSNLLGTVMELLFPGWLPSVPGALHILLNEAMKAGPPRCARRGPS